MTFPNFPIAPSGVLVFYSLSFLQGMRLACRNWHHHHNQPSGGEQVWAHKSVFVLLYSVAMTHQIAGISSKKYFCYLLPKNTAFVTFGRFGHFVSMTFPLCNKCGQAKRFIISLWAFWAVEGGYRCLFCPLSPCPNGWGQAFGSSGFLGRFGHESIGKGFVVLPHLGTNPQSLLSTSQKKNKWRWLQLCEWGLFGQERRVIVVYCCPFLFFVHLLYSAHETKSYSKCQVFAPLPLAFIVSLLTEDHLYTNHGINCTNTFPNSKKYPDVSAND